MLRTTKAAFGGAVAMLGVMFYGGNVYFDVQAKECRERPAAADKQACIAQNVDHLFLYFKLMAAGTALGGLAGAGLSRHRQAQERREQAPSPQV